MVKDCNVDCSESGIAIQAMDNNHIALVSLLLGEDGFSEYRCDRNITLGIHIESLQKVLRCANIEDVLTLRADDNASNLSVTFEEKTQDRISEFKMKLMDINQEHLTIPESEYHVSITMPTMDFQKICRNFANIGDSLNISATKEGVRFSASGDLGDGSVNVKPYNDLEKKEDSVTINIEEPVSSSFNTKYLLDICKASGLSQTISLQLAKDIPLEIEFKLPNGYLRYYLAPKISDQEGEGEEEE